MEQFMGQNDRVEVCAAQRRGTFLPVKKPGGFLQSIRIDRNLIRLLINGQQVPAHRACFRPGVPDRDPKLRGNGGRIRFAQAADELFRRFLAAFRCPVCQLPLLPSGEPAAERFPQKGVSGPLFVPDVREGGKYLKDGRQTGWGRLRGLRRSVSGKKTGHGDPPSSAHG